MTNDIDAAEVVEGLWVGSCPRSPEFVSALRDEIGATGLLSLQTDEDLRNLGLSWSLMWGFLMRQGIAVKRVAIEDFDDKALAAGLPEAVEALHELRSAGHVTYVHCTAGLNRSPTVVIAYLIEHGGLEASEAWDLVHERRQVMPLRKALDRWLRKRR